MRYGAQFRAWFPARSQAFTQKTYRPGRSCFVSGWALLKRSGLAHVDRTNGNDRASTVYPPRQSSVAR